MLKNIFSVKNEGTHKVITILGIKFKYKSKINTIIFKQNEAQMSQSKIIANQEQEKLIINNINNHVLFMSGMCQNCLYNNDFEFNFIGERWNKYLEYLTIENYQKLICGLDANSAKLVARTLSRVKRILASNNSHIDLFDLEEMEEQYYFRHTFLNEVIKIDDNIFAFREYLLPIDHFEKGIFIDKHGVTLLNQDNFKDKAIIDVGAFIGDSALVFSDLTTDKIYSFEVLNDNFELIKKTIEYNKLDNVIPINYALSDKNASVKTINLYENIANGCCCKIEQNDEDDGIENTSQAISLDDFVLKNNINVGLIKVDIEGAEQLFLKGAINTIKSQKPSIIMSIYHNPSDFFAIKPMLQELVPEYRFRLFKPVDNCAILDTVLLCEV